MGHSVHADPIASQSGDSNQPIAPADCVIEREAPSRKADLLSPNLDSPRCSADLPYHATSLRDRLLVFDCHEAWVYQLRLLGLPLDIVVGLRGRQKTDWDEAMRPLPPNARVLRLENIARSEDTYHCIVAHNLSDLLDVKFLAGPRLLVLHEALDGTMLEQRTTVPASELKRAVAQFTEITDTYVVAVSRLKGTSWGHYDDVVAFCADPLDYPAWRGDIACGLRISNHILRRPRTLLWDFHKQAFDGLPVTLVGRNPEMEGVKPATSWADLKNILSHHRFYIHTADPQFEDGYNMATLEAMAAGLPVLGNRHPTSPIVNGVNGFLSDDPVELRNHAIRLLANRELAAAMGTAAQETVRTHFPPSRFAANFRNSLVAARNKRSARQRQ